MKTPPRLQPLVEEGLIEGVAELNEHCVSSAEVHAAITAAVQFAQGEQVVEAGVAAKNPEAQAVHTNEVFAPASVLYVPAAHPMQAVAPTAPTYAPAAHAVHRVPTIAALYVPAPQPRAQKAAVERPLYVRLAAPPPPASQEP